MADSRDVAAYFERSHKNVLQSISNLHCSVEFARLNFQPFKIKDLAGESTSHVLMTKDGFTFLAMGFTGESRDMVADFGRDHRDVLRSARDLHRSPEFTRRNFPLREEEQRHSPDLHPRIRRRGERHHRRRLGDQEEAMSSNDVIPFQFRNKTIRVLDLGGEPWFVAADVCEVLGLAKVDRALAKLNADEQSKAQVQTEGGPQRMSTLSEPGLYRLVMRSDKPVARTFQDWVTREVLPTIRKTGEYRVPGKSPARLSRDAAREARLSWKLATTIAASVGLKGNQLLIAANRYTRRVLGIDMLETMGVPLLPAPEPEVLLTATDIGQRLSLSGGGERNVHPSLDPQKLPHCRSASLGVLQGRKND